MGSTMVGVIQVRVDEILDKISKYGVSSLTLLQKDFMDAYSCGNPDDISKRLEILDNAFLYEDSNFKFELRETIIMPEEVYYVGTLYLPDIIFDNGDRIEGNIEGKIIVFGNGAYALDFEKTTIIRKKKHQYEVFDFCWGLEFELDSFIDYIILELT